MTQPQHDRVLRTRARHRRVAARFHHQPAACLFCGPLPYAMLVNPVKAHRLTERHHVVGQQLDEHLVVTLCVRCHKAVGAGMLDEGWNPAWTPNPLDAADAVFRALAAFFRMLAEACAQYAERLSVAIRRLDETPPSADRSWRAIAEGA